ncbi:MAG: hypothetical protein IPK60_16315 [Sandaracinaceae bacterium]|jgi:hypothetical protein|nr:hypothetical protein [Sandaracinaceae bacterium]
MNMQATKPGDKEKPTPPKTTKQASVGVRPNDAQSPEGEHERGSHDTGTPATGNRDQERDATE